MHLMFVESHSMAHTLATRLSGFVSMCLASGLQRHALLTEIHNRRAQRQLQIRSALVP